MVWLGSLLPYGQAAEVFERVGHRSVAQANIWRETQRQGERLQRAAVAPEAVVLADARQDHNQPKGVSLDGGMVNIRGEGWKEFKAGVVYDVETRPDQDPQTGETVDLPRARQITYAATLGDVKQFKAVLWALLVIQGVLNAAWSSVTADGAEWIWNLIADLLPDSIQIVDWYHATQHLAQAAHALFPQDPVQASDWYKRMLTPLFRGEVWKIIHPLEQAALPDYARYFDHHQRRMQYQQFREEGCLIGSGPVESEIKQFKARLTGPGMRWSRPHAERMLIIRSAVLSNEFDTLWAAA
jgi:hypothetical protein